MSSESKQEAEFLKLIEGNRDRILKICHVYAWDAAEREDLYQEILCQIWRTLPSVKNASFVGTWIYRVALNTSISFVRKHAGKKKRTACYAPAELTRQIEEDQSLPGDQQRLIELTEAIAQLNETDKALIVLFLDGLTYEEMAETLGINPNNAGVALHRAKKKLSDLMKEENRK